MINILYTITNPTGTYGPYSIQADDGVDTRRHVEQKLVRAMNSREVWQLDITNIIPTKNRP